MTVGTADQVVASVVGGESDIGISFNPAPNHQFRAVSKVRQRLCALMVRDHPLARYKSLRLTDCMAYPLAIPVQMLGGRRLLDEAMLEAGLTLNPVLEADNFEVMKQFIAETGGIALEIEIGAIAVLPLDVWQWCRWSAGIWADRSYSALGLPAHYRLAQRYSARCSHSASTVWRRQLRVTWPSNPSAVMPNWHRAELYKALEHSYNLISDCNPTY